MIAKNHYYFDSVEGKENRFEMERFVAFALQNQLVEMIGEMVEVQEIV